MPSFSRVRSLALVTLATLSLGASACKGAPPELEPPSKETTTNAGSTATAQKSAAPTATAPTPPPTTEAAKKPGSGGDPLDGKFTLADATKDLKGSGPIVAKIDTSKGALQCRLYDDKAPVTVANFIGLATGKRPWKDPNSGQWVNKPAYDGTTFHRVIKGFMIQGGDPKGNGSGEPGYVIKDELWEGAKHDRAGLLCMANRGPNTNGAQFFITDAAAAHLDSGYTIFGECAPVEVVHDIANVKTGPMDRPIEAVTIKSVTISRDDKKK
ncbi:Peptidyl-prolyl cis-trans isomerase [Labilithrix luteola]|uniref:Peptidyl-prolyl cis-trans isomerase n=1 Tax=Labilithrix luteola TaxID=1391654 RepID=A0A0K1QDB2_9BACT|nr:peptidylprolyl isomerase [Labilithrix luteola]AKV03662.1 Peptidyl-prolyl cis-trans isomerase [Labilithrix luteola]